MNELAGFANIMANSWFIQIAGALFVNDISDYKLLEQFVEAF